MKRTFLLSAAFLAAFFGVASQAEEMIWDGDGQKLEELCLSRGITSLDVFEANGWEGPPPQGEILRVPASRREALLAQMEAVSRKSAPLVTVKLHGIPHLSDALPQSADAKELLAALGSPDLSPPPKFLPGAPLATPRAVASGDVILTQTMLWPVDGKVTSGFGPRRRRWHMGLDIPTKRGTPIRAARDGVVTMVSSGSRRGGYRGYGNALLLDHGNGLVTMYAHCQKVTVQKGQRVRQGDVVALVGNTGRSTTNHLHFEVRKDGKPVNPILYLPSR
ncbi:MAG: M23 family metallopeptidase [Synergistaceae bacterium]|jgi:murein DD-endopeptidase MepM/ murein hydrolase activator NlpD|nr:M23 family metallopeptidase [Synergistaceae bacterium]